MTAKKRKTTKKTDSKTKKKPGKPGARKELRMKESDESNAAEFDEPQIEDTDANGGDDLLDEEVESEGAWEDPEEEGAEEAAFSEASTDSGDFSDQLLEVHAGVERYLEQSVQSAGATASVESETAFDGAGNILGVGLGTAEDDPTLGPEPGSPCVNLYVAEPCSADEAKAAVVNSMGVSAASSDDVPVNVIVTGPIDALSHRFKIRRVPGGVSCGHYKVTAGTNGCLALGRRAPRNRRLMVLSNNHVLANSNNARFGDSIIQPGRVDGGRSPRDRIAILERFVPIRFGGPTNYVDCATGWAWPSRVRKELVYRSGGRIKFFRISSRRAACRRGSYVGKSGRTTQLTVGRVTDCNATIRVNYGGGRVALFRDQITVRNLQSDFSRGGDSGSVIWTWDGRRNPVGLLFAGGGSYTFGNKIGRVLRALDVRLVT